MKNCWHQFLVKCIFTSLSGLRHFSFLDFEKSIETGEQVVLKTIDIDKADELEGFTLSDNLLEGFAVTSSRRMNTTFIRLQW